MDKIWWGYLCENVNGISLLEKNQHEIFDKYISYNPNIFEKKINFDYKSPHLEEIVKRVFHPNNIERNSTLFYYDLFDEEYF
jgi:hypothetical protein